MRIFFLYIFPIILPTIVYLLWIRRNLKNSNKEYKIIPLPLLLITGIIMAAVVMTALLTDTGSSGDTVYQKASYKDGKIIPAVTIKKESK